MTEALRESGHRVHAEGDPGFVDAAPVIAGVEQFWSWLTPGFFTVGLEFNARLIVDAVRLGLAPGTIVEGYQALRSAAAGSGSWTNIIDAGLADLRTNLAIAVGKAPAAASGGLVLTHAPR